ESATRFRHRPENSSGGRRGGGGIRAERGRERQLRTARAESRWRAGGTIGGKSRGALQANREFLALMALKVYLSRAVAGDGVPFGAGAQTAHVRADRRHRGG